MKAEKYKPIDLTPYQPLGVPLLYVLVGLAIFSISLTMIYEYLL